MINMSMPIIVHKFIVISQYLPLKYLHIAITIFVQWCRTSTSGSSIELKIERVGG